MGAPWTVRVDYALRTTPRELSVLLGARFASAEDAYWERNPRYKKLSCFYPLDLYNCNEPLQDILEEAVERLGLQLKVTYLRDVAYVSTKGGLEVFNYNTSQGDESDVIWEKESELAEKCDKEALDEFLRKMGWPGAAFHIYRSCP